MMPITTTDTGLGTTYERWALNRYLSDLMVRTGLSSVLEGPGDGMTGITGINSLTLGRQGARVALVLPSQIPAAGFARQVWSLYAPSAELEILPVEECDLPTGSGEFDLVWNFNVMTCLPDPQNGLREMARASRRWVLVFVPNRSNYGFWLHHLHHRIARQPWDHGAIELMEPKPWLEMFKDAGLQVQEVVWIDCPPWPDIVDIGQLIADFFPFLASPARRARPENRLRWEAAGLPYYDREAYRQVHDRIERLAFFEDISWGWLKRRFAHHVGILGMKV